MKRLRPRTTVLGGLAIGLIAGAAAYGATSPPAVTPAPAAFRLPSVPAADGPARPRPARPRPARLAPCAAGQKLERGVCIIHVVRTVVVPAPAAASNPASARTAPSNSSAVYQPTSGSSTSGTGTSSTRVSYTPRATYTPRAVPSARTAPTVRTVPTVRPSEPGEHQDATERSHDTEHPTGTSGHDD